MNARSALLLALSVASFSPLGCKQEASDQGSAVKANLPIVVYYALPG